MPVISAQAGVARLEALVFGLLFVSESDSPLRVVRLGPLLELDEPSVRRALNHPADAPITRQPLAALFDRTVVDQPWHGAAERATVERYRALVRFLATELAEVRVYRIGRVEVEAYALGMTADGEWLGVATTLVET